MTAELPRGVIAISLANVAREMHGEYTLHLRSDSYTDAQVDLIRSSAELGEEYAPVLESYITGRSTSVEFETEIRHMLSGEVL